MILYVLLQRNTNTLVITTHIAMHVYRHSYACVLPQQRVHIVIATRVYRHSNQRFNRVTRRPLDSSLCRAQNSTGVEANSTDTAITPTSPVCRSRQPRFLDHNSRVQFICRVGIMRGSCYICVRVEQVGVKRGLCGGHVIFV